MRTETSANYETRLKDLPEIAVAWERRDYELTICGGRVLCGEISDERLWQ